MPFASYLQQASAPWRASPKALAVHLDGARLFNAAVASGRRATATDAHLAEARAIAQPL